MRTGDQHATRLAAAGAKRLHGIVSLKEKDRYPGLGSNGPSEKRTRKGT